MGKIKDWWDGIVKTIGLGFILFIGIVVGFLKIFYNKPDHTIPDYNKLKKREEKLNEDIRKAKKKRDRTVSIADRVKSARERARKRNDTRAGKRTL